MRFGIKVALLSISGVVIVSLFAVSQLAAQSTAGPWTSPVNISKSGAASQPAIAVASDGSLHALWWDATRGEQYARTTDISTTTWTPATDVPGIYGERILNNATGRIEMGAPTNLQLLAGSNGGLYALWYNAAERLQAARLNGTVWSSAVTLTQSSSVMAATSDMSGTLHLTYLKLNDDTDGPAGVYYRTNRGAGWSFETLILASPYFRAVNPADMHVSVASDGTGRNLVTWNDPLSRQGLYAFSSDAGASWSAPIVVNSTQPGGQVAQMQAAAAPNGQFLLLWQEPGTEGCGITQRISLDGGQTWGAPQRVLSTTSRCESRWTFVSNSNGDLWLIGSALSTGRQASVVTLARWDGDVWSVPRDVTFSFFDSSNQRAVDLNCFNVSFFAETAGAIGCDANGDIWAAHNVTTMREWSAVSVSAWDSIEILSDHTNPLIIGESPALASDPAGNTVAVWSQWSETEQSDSGLFTALQTRGRWSRAIRLFSQLARLDAMTAKDDQAALTIDRLGRIHLVWSTGTGDGISYSRVYTRDVAVGQNWAIPSTLPSEAPLNQWPAVAADIASNSIYVIYAVPFNERRGIYMSRSDDGGANWTNPVLVFDAVAAQWESVDKPRLAIDPTTRTVHAVWRRTSAPGSLSPQMILYARSVDNGAHWSEPIVIAQGQVAWPRVAVSAANQVHLIYLQEMPAGAQTSTPFAVWEAVSTDDGQRWTSSATVHGFERISGPAGVASDYSGRLYLTGVGQGPGGESALLFAQWDGRTWTTPESSGLGQVAVTGNGVDLAIAPDAKRLNALLYHWRGGLSGQGQFEVAATSRDITTSSPVVPVPTFTPLPSPSPTPPIVQSPTPTPRPTLPPITAQPVRQNEGASPLVTGGLLAAGIVVVVVARTIAARRRRL